MIDAAGNLEYERSSHMKILEVIDTLAPGGGQRFVVDLCNEMAASNEVYLAKLRIKPNSEFYKKDLDPKVKLLSYDGTLGSFSKVWQIFVVIRMIWKIRPDVVHAHLVMFNYMIFPVLLFPRIKFYYTVHNLADKDTNPGLNFIFKKWLFRKKIRAITISDLCEQSFLDFFTYNSFRMIENGCRKLYTTEDLSEVEREVSGYRRTTDTKVFVNVARLMRQKNHQLLVEAFDEFVSKGFDAVLIIIGDYDSYDEMKKIKSELDAVITTDRIYFVGTKHNVSDYLAVSEFFCLASKYEGLPISLLEAGLSGAYPISTPVGGVPDVVKDESWGLLSADLTVESYVKLLTQAYEVRLDREKIKELYRSRYLMSTCSAGYLKAFKE